MSDPSLKTTQLHGWLERMRAGDDAARDELLRSVCARLERLARKMLRRYPRVQQQVQTGDVLQNSLMRLLRALERVQPDSTRDFFGLAAEQMRRELIDLARHYYGPQGRGSNETGMAPANSPEARANEPSAPGDDRDELERWFRFHQEVEKLPAEEREVVGLIFYHGWPQAQVAELFNVHVRTIRRRWEAAMVKLHAELGEKAAD